MTARRIYMTVMILAVVLSYVATSQATGSFTPQSITFTPQSIQGTWGFSGPGTLGGQPTAAVGLQTFDGVGGCTVSIQLNVGGTVTALTSIQCSYTVNPDGTGSQTLTLAGPIGPFTADFVIVDAKEEFHFIVSDGFGGGTVASAVAKRQQ
jgi:hypothetical protein